jgi:hypothetical protein
MATLRRILKYTPAVVLGVLVVAWSLSIVCWLQYNVSVRYRTAGVSIGESTIELWTSTSPPQTFFHQLRSGIHQDLEFDAVQTIAGELKYGNTPAVFSFSDPIHRQLYFLRVPIPLLLVGMLPLAIGPFISYRFHLWHYLAYTALVAVEFAYYLRWQE